MIVLPYRSLTETLTLGVPYTRPSPDCDAVAPSQSPEAAFSMVHNFKDMTGQRFGHLLVLGRAEQKGLQARWQCQCDCGAVQDVDGHNLRSGRKTSCGCQTKRSVDALERFLAKIQPVESGCWLWTGWRSDLGYGRFSMGGPAYRMIPASRAAHLLFVGPIPDGYHIDHLCRTPPCVNPDHLEAVTPAENTRRGMSPGIVIARSGACARGHPRTTENGWYRKDRPNSWYCVTCERDRQRARRAARRKERDQRVA